MEIGEKIEGTMVLEGLIQGRIPPMGDLADKLREWVTFVGKLGPRFNLEIRANQFSLLPDDKPFAAAGLGAGAEHGLTQALEQLAGLYGPGPERSQLFSTLRSSEYRKKLEVQTVYSITDGKVRIQTRSVEAETTAPPEPISTRQKLKMGLVGMGTALVLLGAAMLIPGVRSMVWQVFETARPFNADELKVEAGPYERWFDVSKDSEKSGRTAVVLKLTRKPEFPVTDEAFDKAFAEVEKSVRARLVLESLIRGKLRFQYFDADGKYLFDQEKTVIDLGKTETNTIVLPLPEKIVVGRIALVP
jgi:hypothetical protein